MNIYCSECGTYCGEIRDAKLRKNLKFVCNGCHTAREKTDIPDFLHGLFRNKKG